MARRIHSLRPFLAALSRLAGEGGGLVALDGDSAAGKTSLAGEIRRKTGCQVFHTDDFFLPFERRTPERLAEPGGNLDRERLIAEVLRPVTRREPVVLSRFNCRTGTMESLGIREYRPLTLVEGAYSMHPDFAGYFSLSLFLSIGPWRQRERILKRNGPAEGGRFFREWIPMEHRYFEKTRVMSRCTFLLDAADLENLPPG